jgi:pimeloyl-ACP methyl ester carboxylesterase
MNNDVSDYLDDDQLIRSLRGFQNGRASVNGTELHYVIGGSGDPLVLLPGWPQNWWAFHKIMPILAEHYRVIVVDIRGMGSSEKPPDGYEKKNMAADVYALVQHLGFATTNIAGHDIGAGVAYSYAANYPEATDKLILLDTPPIDPMIYRLPMLPAPGGVREHAGADGAVYPWWIAFNQIKGLPEDLLLGRGRVLIDWIFNYLLVNGGSVSTGARDIYAKAFESREAIQAMNAWYQAFPQDIIDNGTYGRLEMPVLALGGSGYAMLQQALPPIAANVAFREIQNGGHFIAEEKPNETASCIHEFLGQKQSDLVATDV